MGKTLIKVECVDQRLLVSSGPIIASGGRNEDEIEFSFCPLWDGFEKTAVFHREKDRAYHAAITDDRCVIPHEVLIDEGWMYFGVMGVKGDITRTSEILKYRITEGAITEGTKPSDPTPNIYEQILAQLSTVNKRLDQIGGASLDPQPFEVTGKLVQLDNFEGMPMNAVTRIEPVQAGSGEPSPSNIRPISGHTGAKLTRVGKNLVSESSATGSLSAYTKVLHIKSELMPNTTYTLSFVASRAENNLYLNEHISARQYFATTGKLQSITFTTAEKVDQSNAAQYDTARGWIIFKNGVTNAEPVTFSDVQLEFGNASSPFEPYHGETFSASFGQNVYGGTLDWGKGVLTVDRAIVTLTGTENFQFSSGGASRFVYYGLQNVIKPFSNSAIVAPIVCSHYKPSTADYLYNTPDAYAIAQNNGTEIWFSDTGFDSPSAFKAYLSAQNAAGTPVQVCYKLANPTTIQLTPAQLTALQGMNNIFCDAGETTVSGRKDILWLTSHLIERINALESAIISTGGNV